MKRRWQCEDNTLRIQDMAKEIMSMEVKYKGACHVVSANRGEVM